MSDTPPGYGRTQMLAEVSHTLAQRAYARLDLLERAFAALPGAAAVDLDALSARALADLIGRNPRDDGDELRETLAASVARMRGEG